jgi:hypothetical protein
MLGGAANSLGDVLIGTFTPVRSTICCAHLATTLGYVLMQRCFETSDASLDSRPGVLTNSVVAMAERVCIPLSLTEELTLHRISDPGCRAVLWRSNNMRDWPALFDR